MRSRPQLTVRESRRGTRYDAVPSNPVSSNMACGDVRRLWSDEVPVCIYNSKLNYPNPSPVIIPSKQVLMTKVDEIKVSREIIDREVNDVHKEIITSVLAPNIIKQVESGSPDEASFCDDRSKPPCKFNSTTVEVPGIILPEPQKSIETKGSLLCSEEAINVPPCVPQCQQASNVVQLTTLRLLHQEINLDQQSVPFVDSKVPDAESNGKSSSSLNSCVVQELSAQNVVMANDVVTCHLSCRESKDVETSRSSQMITCSVMQRENEEIKCNLYGGSVWLMADVNGRHCPLLLDTGSAITIFNDNFGSPLSSCQVRAAVANGEQMMITGVAMMELRLGSELIRAEVFVSPKVIDNVLGLDVMRKLRSSIDLAEMKFRFRDQVLSIYNTDEMINTHLYRVNMGGRLGISVVHRSHLYQANDIEDDEDVGRAPYRPRRV
jgi:hypothetical protein